MKKYIVLLITISLFFTSCNNSETDYLFEKSINERTAELKSQYTNILTDSENGWIGYYTPNGSVGTTAILFKFDKNGNVVLKSDYDSGNQDRPTTYRIDKTLKIELVFESNTVLHSIYEVNNNDNEGEYVFNIINATADKVLLQSKTDNGYNGQIITELELVPAKASDWDLSTIQAMHSNIQGDPSSPVWRYIAVAGTPIATFSYNSTDRAATFSYTTDGKTTTETVPISVNNTGFCLLKSISINNNTISCFSWNELTKIFENEDINASISYFTKPLAPTDDYLPFLDGNPSIAFGYITSYLGSAPSNSLEANNLLAEINNNLPKGITISRVQLIFNSIYGSYLEYRFAGGKSTEYHNVQVVEDPLNKTIIFQDLGWDSGSTPAVLAKIDAKLMNAAGLYVTRESFTFGGPPNTIYTFTDALTGTFRLTTYAFQ
ncbi:hypothetical protein HNQ02_002134 [Flavobacterium sp. 7E]|uniref:DUF4302 domain-containing protein n=1 Tax=Flavobacterium sp. 7E TaxID=2735898 RepID=UPI001570F0C4|nr:DUF4302 domain-containing protein [Flavobacterium sp. 7E]NRS89212.1 hypothetical protein [Flavobacterium sp. 7E]